MPEADTQSGSRDDPLSSLLAGRIRRERDARNWTIAELAAASGVSRAMISRIERAEASPTAALLGKLSGAFGLTVSALLARAEADGNAGRLSRAAERAAWTDPETGYVRHTLSPPGAEPEMVLVDLPAGKSVGYPAASYAFMRGQCVWVMKGRLRISEGDDVTDLGPGDCLAFDLATTQERRYANPSERESATYIVSLVRR